MGIFSTFLEGLAIFSCLSPIATAAEQQQPLFGTFGTQNMVLFLNGFHFINGKPNEYLQADHYCVVMDEDFIQCAIYVPDTNPRQYIISADAFEKLDIEERQLWHSHKYEVQSGFLAEPGTPAGVDKEAMKILVNTYGKTTHTWRWDQKNNTLPLGIPEIVSGYTDDGQLTPSFVEERDEYFGINTTQIRESRADIPARDVIEGADIWKEGIVLTLELKNVTKNTSFPGA